MALRVLEDFRGSGSWGHIDAFSDKKEALALDWRAVHLPNQRKHHHESEEDDSWQRSQVIGGYASVTQL